MKTNFCVSKESFWGLVFFIRFFWNIFGQWVKSFRSSVQNFLHVLWIILREDIFWWSFVETFWELSATVPGRSLEVVGSVVKITFYVSKELFWGTSFFNNFPPILVFVHWAKNFRPFGCNFKGGLWKIFSACPRNRFEGEYFSSNFSETILVTDWIVSVILFRIFSQFFSVVHRYVLLMLSKAPLYVSLETFFGTFFRIDSIVFVIFDPWGKKFWFFDGFFYGWSSKLHFKCP